MQLKILLPFKVFAQKQEVLRIVAESRSGSLGLLPQRLDCVAALTPGIFIYETAAEGEVCVAVDEGILVKAGDQVLVCVRNAVGGTDLGKLHEAVKQQFLNLDEQERTMREILAKLEGNFVLRLAALHHD
ncbi:MAG TPA: F0F1 ATP synthase subunit epsilon [Pseudomonas sp.]|uniref:F0F1 ATP synthase subunit epsilon n=1 Tax=Pseudomonas sp. TaxID=306 RepID=UPI002EDB4A8F